MTAALEITSLKKIYANGYTALNGIDLTVQQGDFFALLGPNGAGKSTAIGIICGLVHKTSGTVRVFGHDTSTHAAQAKSCIGLVPQEFNFNMWEPIQEILINQAGYYGIKRSIASERAEHYLHKLHLWDKRKSIARDLSGGMKRRLMIARALIHQPQLLILDEPTAGVDLEIRHATWDYIQEINASGTTIILTTHYLEEAEQLCRNIAIINEGSIKQQDNMQQLLRQLDSEIFVLNLQKPLALVPDLAGFDVKQIDALNLEVEVTQQQGVNALFEALTQAGIEVTSLRNKNNRLETLFLRLTAKG